MVQIKLSKQLSVSTSDWETPAIHIEGGTNDDSEGTNHCRENDRVGS
jgi:hypothetical protein